MLGKNIEIKEGDSFSLGINIDHNDIDLFARISGDNNPLHVDADFARERGFKDRVVHGAHLIAFVSRMIGTQCPGRDALIHSYNIQFSKPVYAGDSIRILAVVAQVSPATKTIVVKINIENSTTGQVYASGKVQVGYSQPETKI